MTPEERRAVTVTAFVLLAASLVRFAWEARPVPPLLPPGEVPAALLEETRREVALEERRRTPLAPGERIDPNRAPEVELSRLPGIGPATAARILESRALEGPFRRPEDLERVSGIGPATVARIRAHLDLSDPPVGGSGPRVAGSGGPTAVGGGVGSPRAGGAARPAAAPGLPGRVDVNRAGPDELVRLPGVGPALAERIMERRRVHGPFRVPEDLLDVPGIGPATLERLRPLIRLGP